jgi:SPP1 family predicted phage head-tail adaptor
MLPRRLNTGTAYVPTGSMNTRVSLLKPSQAKDANGDFVQKEELVCVVWAKVEAITQKYTDRPELTVTEATHLVTIRFMAGITSKNLVGFADGRVWNIESAVDPDEKQVNLKLYCFERR